MRAASSMFKVISLLLVFFCFGCSDDTREKGAALAKQGTKTSIALKDFYNHLEMRESQALVLDSIAGNNVTQSRDVREKILVTLGQRVIVAKRFNETYEALLALSDYNAREAASGAADKLATSLNGLTGIFQGPSIPTGLFGWFIGEITAAKQNRDIVRGARALRWAVHDFKCILDVEVGDIDSSRLLIADDVLTKTDSETFESSKIDALVFKSDQENKGAYAPILLDRTARLLTVLEQNVSGEGLDPLPGRYIDLNPVGNIAQPLELVYGLRADTDPRLRKRALRLAATRILLDLHDSLVLLTDTSDALASLLSKHDELFEPGERPPIPPGVRAELEKSNKELLEKLEDKSK